MYLSLMLYFNVQGKLRPRLGVVVVVPSSALHVCDSGQRLMQLRL